MKSFYIPDRHVVSQVQQQILNNNKGKFFSTIKESDFLKLNLTHLKTMMKIHLQGILKQKQGGAGRA
jgi:hypothetical protein